MSTFSLAAVSGFEGKSGVAFSADLLVAVKFLGDGSDRGVHDTSSESEDQVKSRLFLDVVVGKAAPV